MRSISTNGRAHQKSNQTKRSDDHGQQKPTQHYVRKPLLLRTRLRDAERSNKRLGKVSKNLHVKLHFDPRKVYGVFQVCQRQHPNATLVRLGTRNRYTVHPVRYTLLFNPAPAAAA